MKLKTEIGNFGRIIRPRHRLEDLDMSKSQSDQIVEVTQAEELTSKNSGRSKINRSDRMSGISVLFAGPSGTGKTMAAEATANRLDRPLLRVDLSMVVNKYIGETEKNLNQVFDAASQLGAVLLLDEADDLFGKRTEVKDSHDRYANQETDYLLQKIETHTGLVILSTNYLDGKDKSFLRRFRLTIRFDNSSGQKNKRSKS